MVMSGSKPCVLRENWCGRPMQGLEWFLKMYVEGGCTDYRFTYDAYAPAPSQILSAFAADSLDEASTQAHNLGQDNETSDAPSAAPLPSNNQVNRDRHPPLILHARPLMPETVLGLLAS